MDEPIFDPVTYALLKSQLKTDEIKNDSEYITGEDLTEALNSLYDAIGDLESYKVGGHIPLGGMYAAITNSAGNIVSFTVFTNKKIPSGRTYTPSRIPAWIRGDGLASGSHFSYELRALTRFSDYSLVFDYDITPVSGVTIPAVTAFIAFFDGGSIDIS